jgi:hypothetical protein
MVGLGDGSLIGVLPIVDVGVRVGVLDDSVLSVAVWLGPGMADPGRVGVAGSGVQVAGRLTLVPVGGRMISAVGVLRPG